LIEHDQHDDWPEPRETGGDGAYYVSWTEKSDPQPIAPGQWVRLRWPLGTDLPTIDDALHVTLQLYPDLADDETDPTYLKVKLVRLLPDGSEDATAIGTYTVPKRLRSWALPPHTTFMQCSADTPLAVDVYHNGDGELTFGNRIAKLWNEQGAELAAADQWDADAAELLGARP
jgi:hypothetical protein